MRIHRAHISVGLAALSLALVGVGCGGSSGLKQHNEAVNAINTWTRANLAVDKRTSHVFANTRPMATSGWRYYLRLQKQQDQVLAGAWKDAPSYVHQLYGASYRAHQQRSAAFISAGQLYLRMSLIPISNVPAVNTALGVAHQASHRAFSAASRETNVEARAYSQAQKYTDSLKR